MEQFEYFLELGEDCVYHTLEFLDFWELSRIQRVSSEFAVLCATSIQRKRKFKALHACLGGKACLHALRARCHNLRSGTFCSVEDCCAGEYTRIVTSFTKLETLWVEFFHGDLFTEISKNLSKLTSLELFNYDGYSNDACSDEDCCNEGYSDGDDILCDLSMLKCDELKCLTVDALYLDLLNLDVFLRQNPLIEELSLTYNSIVDASLMECFNSAGSLPNLKTLDLDLNFEALNLGTLCTVCPNIEEMQISMDNDSNVVGELSPLIKLQCLRTLLLPSGVVAVHLASLNGIGVMRHLEDMYCGRSPVSDASVQAMPVVMPNLRVLALSCSMSGFNNLLDLATLCRLTLYNSDLSNLKNLDNKDRIFQSLKELKAMWCDIRDSGLSTVRRIMPRVEKITIMNRREISTSALHILCGENGTFQRTLYSDKRHGYTLTFK